MFSKRRNCGDYREKYFKIFGHSHRVLGSSETKQILQHYELCCSDTLLTYLLLLILRD